MKKKELLKEIEALKQQVNTLATRLTLMEMDRAPRLWPRWEYQPEPWYPPVAPYQPYPPFEITWGHRSYKTGDTLTTRGNVTAGSTITVGDTIWVDPSEV